MVSLQVWFDKLPEDKVKYYNRSRMSIEMFSMRLGIAPQVILQDLAQYGYRYYSHKHLIGY